MRLRRAAAGQALAEFVLVVPLLMLMIIGCVEAARLGGDLLVLRHASYTATRSATVGVADAEIRFQVGAQVAGLAPRTDQWTEQYRTDPATGRRQYVVRYGTPGADQWVELRLTAPAADRRPGDLVLTELEWTFRPLFLGWIFDRNATFTSRTQGRVEAAAG